VKDFSRSVHFPGSDSCILCLHAGVAQHPCVGQLFGNQRYD